MKILVHWFISALAIGIAAAVVPGVMVTAWGTVIAAVVLGALNLIIKPILVVLTLPITIVTLGLFSLVINAALVLLTSLVVPGFVVVGFWSAFLFSLVLSVINWVFDVWNRA